MKDYMALPIMLILAVVFFAIMSAFTQTYSWADTALNWQIFGAVEILIVMSGLILTVKKAR